VVEKPASVFLRLPPAQLAGGGPSWFQKHPLSLIPVLWLFLLLPTLACARGDDATGAPAPSFPSEPGAVLVDEPFADTTTHKWDVYNDRETRAEYEVNRLLLAIDVPDEVAWSLLQDNGAEFGDVALDLDVTALAGPTDNSFGLIFRYKDRWNFYSFDVSSDGYYRLQLRRGTSNTDWQAHKLIDWTPSAAVRPGLDQPNHLRLVAKGTAFTLIINGQTVNQFTDTTLSRGRIGVSAGSFQEPGVQIAFDNLVVSNP
jgi:hypothetical protein